VLEEMVGMIIGPGPIFAMGSVLVGFIALLISGAAVKGTKAETFSLLNQITGIHQ